MTAKIYESAANKAIRQLRKTKLSQGLPFLINTQELPSDQCYLEYPDGSIQRVTLSKSGMDFKVLDNLSSIESQLIRKQLKLF